MYAIIISHFISDYIRLATGGKNGCFNSEAIQVKCNARPGGMGATKRWKERTAELGTIHRGLFPVLPDKAADASIDD